MQENKEVKEELTVKKQLNIIESILFAVGDRVHIKEIMNTLDIDKITARDLINTLKNEYDENERGIMIVQTEDSYQLTTRKEYFDYVKNVLTNYNTTTLSQAALETLSIVAYKQPVTRLDIELIRGVKSSSSLDLLIDRNLVQCIGRMDDIIGKPMCFGTTDEFLRLAGITKIEDLPEFEQFLGDIENHLDEKLIEEAKVKEEQLFLFPKK